MKWKDDTFFFLCEEKDENVFNHSFSIETSDNSRCDTSDYSCFFTQTPRYVDWRMDDEYIIPIEDLYSENLNIQKSVVRIDDVWKGVVIHVEQCYFEARIQEKNGKYEERIIRVQKDKLDEEVWERLYEGAQFEWSFGQEYKNKQIDFHKLSISPKVSYNMDDIERLAKEMTRGFEEILKKHV